MDDEYGALLRSIHEFCWRVTAGSSKSADLILHLEPPLLKQRCDAMGDFKIKKVARKFTAKAKVLVIMCSLDKKGGRRELPHAEISTVSRKNATFYFIKDGTFFPRFMSNEPGTALNPTFHFPPLTSRA
jgi:hypothetical protein